MGGGGFFSVAFLQSPVFYEAPLPRSEFRNSSFRKGAGSVVEQAEFMMFHYQCLIELLML